ncbi:11292_t:CDS:1 [Ambispora gerdemannii]|uniref:11292_t:CDS:1 n=1 Tax=Ambispora gerdemannii TaxID=144530 RepID=A0A9N8WFN5_9GLOM|nr:11292_t:CDS:1 [Ambispora gerdemannii]
MFTKISVIFVAIIFFLASATAFLHEKRAVSYARFVPDASKGLTVEGTITYTDMPDGCLNIVGQFNKGFEQSSNPSDYKFSLDGHRFDSYLQYTIQNGGTSAFTANVPAKELGINPEKKRGPQKKRQTEIDYKEKMIGLAISESDS